MEIELYIHGNPYGFAYKGPAKEQNLFFERFYNNRAKRVEKDFIKELIIERLHTDGKICYYYTFLVCGKNVRDTHNRPCSYCGISVRFDSCYPYVSNLYTLFDTIYNKWIIGKVLRIEKWCLQYTLDEFDSNVVDNIQKDVVDWIQNAIKDTDLYNLQALEQTTNQIATLNFADASSDNVRGLLQQYNALSISTEYALLRESHHDEALKKINQDWQQKYNEIQTNYNNEMNSSQTQQATIQTLRKDLKQKEKDLESLQKEFEKAQIKQKLVNELTKIQPALISIGNLLNSMGLETNASIGFEGEHQKNGTRRHRVKIVFVVGIIVGAIFTTVCFTIKGCSETINNSEYIYKNDKHEAGNYNTSNIFDVTDNEKVVNNENEINADSENVLTEDDVINISDLQIDVKEFTRSNHTMKIYTEYHIRICQQNQPMTLLQGRWEIEQGNCDIRSGDYCAEALITPTTGGDSLKIKFIVNGNEQQTIKRTIYVTN